MSKQTQNYIDSQQHWENNINDDYYLQKQIDKQMEKDIEKQIYNEWEKQNKIIIQKDEIKQLNQEDFGIPKFGTKEFNNLASHFFGGKAKPKEEK
jgi:hypothetical protein